MRRLDRVAAFTELDEAERTEQLVGDMQHEVWRCASCGELRKVARSGPLAAQRSAAPVGSATHHRQWQRSGLSLFSDGPGARDAEAPPPPHP
jgi:hypothetical protein